MEERNVVLCSVYMHTDCGLYFMYLPLNCVVWCKCVLYAVNMVMVWCKDCRLATQSLMYGEQKEPKTSYPHSHYVVSSKLNCCLSDMTIFASKAMQI